MSGLTDVDYSNSAIQDGCITRIILLTFSLTVKY